MFKGNTVGLLKKVADAGQLTEWHMSLATAGMDSVFYYKKPFFAPPKDFFRIFLFTQIDSMHIHDYIHMLK